MVGANVCLPANPAAASSLAMPALKQILSVSHSAPYIQTYFDIAFPTSVGQALDAAIASYFAGQGTPSPSSRPSARQRPASDRGPR